MALYVFLLMQLLYSIAIQGTRPIVSLFANSQGANDVIIGLLVSTFAFFPMLFAVSVGKWLDRFGGRMMVFLGGSGMFISLLVPIIFPNVGTVFVSQVLIGISQLCVLVSLQKTVGNWSGNRDRLIATFSLMGSGGELLGPLINGFCYQHFGFQISFGLSAVLICLSLLLILFIKKETWNSGGIKRTQKTKTKASSWLLLRNVNLRKAMVVSGLVLYSKDLFVAYFPIYSKSLGYNASEIGVMLSVMAGMAIVVRLLQSWLVKTMGRGNVLMTTLIISGITYLLVPLNSAHLILVVLAGLLGIGLGLGQPLSLVYALNLSPKESQGQVLGMRLTFNRGFQFTAPLLFGSIGGVLGLLPIFWVSGGILLIGSYITRFRSTNEVGEQVSGKKSG